MIERWDVITIGNISRNRYWGEGDDRGRRPALCTCTLVRAKGFVLLVDPSIEDAERMAAELDRRSGLKPADVNRVFVTHAHNDHHAGLRHFADATWLASPGVAESINRESRYPKAIEPAGSKIDGLVDVIPTPGHTPDHHSLRFDCEGMSVVISGDAVMTRDFFRERRGYFNSVDPAVASATITRLAELAGIIVPGHDNYFLTRRR